MDAFPSGALLNVSVLLASVFVNAANPVAQIYDCVLKAGQIIGIEAVKMGGENWSLLPSTFLCSHCKYRPANGSI